MEGNAYGAGMAGKPFDVLDYIKKPSVILRFISWVRTCSLDSRSRLLCLDSF